MPSQGYSTRPAHPSRRTRSRRTSQATTYIDPAYSYDERDALLDRTRQGLDAVQQTYIKPIWEYDPEQVWTRKSSPNIPPLEYFLAEARAKYNSGDTNRVNHVSDYPEYWSAGGYQYGYPEGISPPYHTEVRNPQLSYQSSGRSRRTDRSSTLVGTDSRRVSSTLVDSNRSSLNRSHRESRSQRDSRRMSVPVVEPTRTTSNRSQRATRTSTRPARTSRPRAQTPHPRASGAYSRIPEPVQSVSANLVKDKAFRPAFLASLHHKPGVDRRLIPGPLNPIKPSLRQQLGKSQKELHGREGSHRPPTSNLADRADLRDRFVRTQAQVLSPAPQIIPELAYLAQLPAPVFFAPPKSPPNHSLPPPPPPPLINLPHLSSLPPPPTLAANNKFTVTPSKFVTHSSYDLRPHNLVAEEQELHLQRRNQLLFTGLSSAGVGSWWSPESTMEEWDGETKPEEGDGHVKKGRIRRIVTKTERKEKGTKETKKTKERSVSGNCVAGALRLMLERR